MEVIFCSEIPTIVPLGCLSGSGGGGERGDRPRRRRRQCTGAKAKGVPVEVGVTDIWI